MLKYVDTKVTFQEIPDEITLCISISGCQIRCPDCHSKYLWDNIGEELKPVVLSDLIAKNNGITAICFMGGEHDTDSIINLVKWIKNTTELKVGWYCGLDKCPIKDISNFNYLKLGSYNKEKGGLNSSNTNQRMYKISTDNGIISMENITSKFRKSSGINGKN